MNIDLDFDIKEFNSIYFCKEEIEYILFLLEADKKNNFNASLRVEFYIMLEAFND